MEQMQHHSRQQLASSIRVEQDTPRRSRSPSKWLCCFLSCCGINLRFVVSVFGFVALLFAATGVFLDFTIREEFVVKSSQSYHKDQSDLDLATRAHSIYSIVSVMTHMLSIFGAQSYSVILVGVGAFWIMVGLALNLYTNIPMFNDDMEQNLEDNTGTFTGDQLSYEKIGISAAISAVFLYPHICFMIVYRKGKPQERNDDDYTTLVPTVAKGSQDETEAVEMMSPMTSYSPQDVYYDYDDDTGGGDDDTTQTYRDSDSRDTNVRSREQGNVRSFFNYMHSQVVQGA